MASGQGRPGLLIARTAYYGGHDAPSLHKIHSSPQHTRRRDTRKRSLPSPFLDELLHATVFVPELPCAPLQSCPGLQDSGKDRVTRKRVLPHVQAADDRAPSHFGRDSSHLVELRPVQSVAVAYIRDPNSARAPQALILRGLSILRAALPPFFFPTQTAWVYDPPQKFITGKMPTRAVLCKPDRPPFSKDLFQ